MKLKNIVLVGCVCILGLILIATYMLTDKAHDGQNVISGTMLYNNTHDDHFKALIEIIEPDGFQKTIILSPDSNGTYKIPVNLNDAIKKLSIYYEDKLIIEYGPPFEANRDYGVNYNVRGDAI